MYSSAHGDVEHVAAVGLVRVPEEELQHRRLALRILERHAPRQSSHALRVRARHLLFLRRQRLRGQEIHLRMKRGSHFPSSTAPALG